MKLSDFDYDLPDGLIAQYPTKRRDGSRLLEIDTTEEIHRKFTDFPDLLNCKDVLVLNDTKVLKARLFAEKDTGGAAEILIERLVDNEEAECQVRVSKALKPGRLLQLGGFQIEVLRRVGQFYRLRFSAPVHIVLDRYGTVPLPPYIERSSDIEDLSRYQTIFGNNPGAIAAPTAGLHFTEETFKKLESKGVSVVFLTLHVGSGTFQPVRTDVLDDHTMHSELFTIPGPVAEKINNCEGRVVAVGTTVVRALESSVEGGVVKGHSGETSIFIQPGYNFQVVDALLTNFHLPKSTLLMLVSAFGGYEEVMRAYQVAIKKKYRFFSYGDACFVHRKL